MGARQVGVGCGQERALQGVTPEVIGQKPVLSAVEGLLVLEVFAEFAVGVALEIFDSVLLIFSFIFPFFLPPF